MPSSAQGGAMEDLTGMFRCAWLIRRVEQRLLSLFSQGKLFGTVHTCIGQELSAVAVAWALQPGDTVFSNHRGHGHFIAHTGCVAELIAEIMGRRTGICGGRGGSQHLCCDGFFSNGIQGGMMSIAAGWAWAHRRRQAASVTCIFIGDGTLGEGAVYETMNLISKWSLPVMMVVEDNGIAQSTEQVQTLAGTIEGRAAAFAIDAMTASTNDPTALLDAAQRGASLVREQSRPVLLHVKTSRLMAHSKGDDTRAQEQIDALRRADPLTQFAQAHPTQIAEWDAEIDEALDAAVAAAEAAPIGSITPASASMPIVANPPQWTPIADAGEGRIVDRIHDALADALANDDRVVLLGEDIEGPYGGAFKVTRDLSLRFPTRVCNTPISEATIVGLATGAALAGDRPIAEIMFGDFLTLTTDAWINHAAKFRYMYNDRVRVPMIVRTPMGGRRGYGPTHSQSLEKHFVGVPDTQVLAPNGRIDPKGLYAALFSEIDRPTLVIENKTLYTQRIASPLPTGFIAECDDAPFPTLRIRPMASPEVTLVCYGGMQALAEQAVDILFDQHDCVVEIVCPTCLWPLRLAPILESVRKTARLLVVEEGHGFAAVGSEIVAQVVESLGATCRTVRRLYAPDHAIPSGGQMEAQTLPAVQEMVHAVLEVIDE
jgi:2-oxoisovalerate dehydrogenase E1 component